MNYYIGVDIGTTSVKVIAFSAAGDMLLQQSLPYGMYHPQPGYHEQDADEIRTAVTGGINSVIKALLPQVPELISFSAAMHSLVVVDMAGKPVTRCMIWADNRAAAIAENLRNSEQGNNIYQATGVPVHAMSPLCKLLWLQQFAPGIFNEAHKFIGIKEYIWHTLFGEYLIDTSVASATGLLNIHTLRWDESIAAFAQVTLSKLSTVVSVKHVLYYDPAQPHSPAALLNLNRKTAFVIGSSDGALANLGAGATDIGSMAVTIGTSVAARVITNQPETDRHMRTFCYHAKDNQYIIGGAGNNGAIVLQWLRETLLQATENNQQLFDLAASVAPGSDGLLFLPYILGERAPLWNSNAKGVFFGIDIHHAKPHLIRACLEGIMFGIFSIAKILMEKRSVTEVYATGGFAGSAFLLQLLADVFNRKIIVSDTIESSALGAVMVGMEAMGMNAAINKNIVSVHEPDAARHGIYIKQFQQFERLYALLKEEFTPDPLLISRR